MPGGGALPAGREECLDAKNAWRILARDHANHLSPNCAWSESAAAGALGVRLGGNHNYFGKLVEKPSIGDARREIERADVGRANRLMYATAVEWAVVLAILGVIL